MTRLRRPLLALVALFTLAITIDRIGVGRGSDAIGSHVYALAALAVVAPLAIAGLRRERPWLPATMAITAYAGIVLFSGGGLPGDIHVAATEAAFLLLVARLGHELARAVAHVDDTLATIAFGDSTAVDIGSPEAADVIQGEIARSRRHDRPLTLTVLAPTRASLDAATEGSSLEVDQAVRERYVHGKLARAVGAQLRRSDLLYEHRPSGRLFVLSPETGRDAGELLVKRVGEAARTAGVDTAVGVASFPNDAIGFDTLVDAAQADLATRLEPTRLRAVEQGSRR